MSKIAIVTDSNSGITQKQGEEIGVYVLPMPFDINHVTYYEDIDLTQDEFYKMLTDGISIATSQPSIESVLKLWDTILKDNDALVHIPMSSGLSGSCETAVMLSKEYNGRVFVADNKRVSVTQRQSVLDAKRLAEKGMSAKEIHQFLEETKYESSIYITVDTLKYLKKGGRITPAAAALGTLLKIKPVLQIQGDKLDAFAKTRTIKQAKNIMIDAIKKDIETKFHTSDQTIPVKLQIAHTNNFEAAAELKLELEALFPGYEIYIDCLSLSVSCHIGPGALAIACTKNLIK